MKLNNMSMPEWRRLYGTGFYGVKMAKITLKFLFQGIYKEKENGK